jgi:imidazolonepropionase
VKDGLILQVGDTDTITSSFTSSMSVNAEGTIVLPGLVDPHTHLVWAGDRAIEFEMRVAGATYMEILEAGGGILSTVEDTRKTPTDQLVQSAQKRLVAMLTHGTTTAEVKTGYGLDLETEIRQLETILLLDQDHPVDLIPTFLGAHAVPSEFRNRSGDPTQRYTDHLCEDMLPAIAEWWKKQAGERPLPFVDVFCEQGVFSLEQSRQILQTAQRLGFPLKIHADEFEGLGGTAMAVELGAVSADHLVQTPPADIQTLGNSDTVAVSLPGTPFGLGEHEYTPASDILKAGGVLALATDLNPGTCWCESMQFIIGLACRELSLTPAQAIAASTINAAAAVGRSNSLGSLDEGKAADFLMIDAPDYRHLGYRFGTNLVQSVYKNGKHVAEKGRVVI